MSVAPCTGAPQFVSASLDRSLIKDLPLFSGMAEDDLDDVLVGASSRRYEAGTSVFEQGAVAEQFFVLLHGRLRVTHLTPEGQQTVVRMVSPGDLFGIAKALRRPDYPGTATAVVESVALAWPMDRWDQLLPRHPSLAINAMQTMGQRLQEAQTLVRELSNEEVERRVAHAVLRLASQSGLKEGSGIRIDFPVSKQDIAEMTGTTLHTVSRILTAWEHAGLVEGGRQKLLVKESHRLMMIADGAAPGLL
jgi:CRP-like cAMP-binding protein